VILQWNDWGVNEGICGRILGFFYIIDIVDSRREINEAVLAGFFDYSCDAYSRDYCDELFLFELTTGNIT
jgi:hypothetical protein